MTGPVSLEVAGRRVTITHPDKVVFPGHGGRGPYTKLDLVRYYLAVADGALRGVAGRPMILKRFVKGIAEEAVFQKRAPTKRPDWVDVAELRYARGTSAAEAVIHDAAGLAWAINLGCVDLNPHPVLADDLDHPDELRVDLDPMPGVSWRRIVDVALVAREVLEDYGLVAWPKTSGSRGFHIYARIAPRWRVHRRCGWPPRPSRARSSGGYPTRRPAAGGRKSARGCSSTSTRTPRTARSRRPTRCGRLPTRGCRRRCTGTRSPTAVPRSSPSSPCPAGSPTSVTRGRGWMTPVGELDRLLVLAEELGPPERAPKGSGKLPTAGASLVDAAHRDRPHQDQGRGAGRAGHLARPLPRGGPRLQPADVLVDGMRGPSSIWYRIRINLQHVPVDQRPPQEELIADYSPWRGA